MLQLCGTLTYLQAFLYNILIAFSKAILICKETYELEGRESLLGCFDNPD